MSGEVLCSICLGVLYKPIVLPCNHVFCQDCISDAVDHTAYQCPICRFRLSNWLRKVKNLDCLVNENRENELRRLFPSYYRDRELGKSPMLSKSEQKYLDDITNKGKREGIPASQGEIFSDYLSEIRKTSEQRQEEERSNEEASLALALQLLAEDELLGMGEFSTAAEDVNSSFESSMVLGNTSIGPSPSTSKNSFGKSTESLLQKRNVKKTLLDYAADDRSLRTETEVGVVGADPEDQIQQDEEFARKLQLKFFRSPVTPVVPVTRSKRSTLRSRNRNVYFKKS